MADYIRDPTDIYRRSFAQVCAETDLARLPASLHDMAVRLVHACGMPDIVADIAFGGDVAAAGREALAAGAPVLVDANMVAVGIARRRLPSATKVICTLDRPEVASLSQAIGNTRSAAAVDLWRPMLEGAIVAVGNAPTALFRLLEILAEGAPRPAAILGFPVGFVGAAESKQALIDAAGDIPFITLCGRRGGSALAAAAVNALGSEPA